MPGRRLALFHSRDSRPVAGRLRGGMKQHLKLFIPSRRFRVSVLGSFILTAKSSCDSGPNHVLACEGDKSRSFFFPALEELALKRKKNLPTK
jgi:hypothetical protein